MRHKFGVRLAEGIGLTVFVIAALFFAPLILLLVVAATVMIHAAK